MRALINTLLRAVRERLSRLTWGSLQISFSCRELLVKLHIRIFYHSLELARCDIGREGAIAGCRRYDPVDMRQVPSRQVREYALVFEVRCISAIVSLERSIRLSNKLSRGKRARQMQLSAL